MLLQYIASMEADFYAIKEVHSILLNISTIAISTFYLTVIYWL